MYIYILHIADTTIIHRHVLVRAQDSIELALLFAMGISQLQAMQVQRTAAGVPRKEHRIAHPNEVFQLHPFVTMATIAAFVRAFEPGRTCVARTWRRRCMFLWVMGCGTCSSLFGIPTGAWGCAVANHLFVLVQHENLGDILILYTRFAHQRVHAQHMELRVLGGEVRIRVPTELPVAVISKGEYRTRR